MSPLQQAFLHFPGIGSVKSRWLHEAGIYQWSDLLTSPVVPRLSGIWSDLQAHAEANLQSLEGRDWSYFIDHLDCGDRWRLVHQVWPLCHYLDIETTGLEYDTEITLISVWNGSELRLFVKDENLEDFPDYLLTLPMVITFNGSTFDVPVIKRYFNLPDFPAPHIDMRWICHRCDLTGGLKNIEQDLNLLRPQDLQGVNGLEAVQLWQDWTETRNPSLRSRLLRYCAADTIALQHVTAALLRRQTGDYERFALDPSRHWHLLDQQVPFIPDTSGGTPRTPIPSDSAASDSGPMGTVPPENLVHTPSELRNRLRTLLARKRAAH